MQVEIRLSVSKLYAARHDTICLDYITPQSAGSWNDLEIALTFMFSKLLKQLLHVNRIYNLFIY